MQLAIEFLERNGWNVKDVSHVIGEHGGYDLLAQKVSQVLTIEVKGSSKRYEGIPDLHDTQVNESRKLVADYLFVGYFPSDDEEGLAIFPSDYFHPGDAAFTPKLSWVIHSSYKNERRVREHLVDRDEPWKG